MKRYPVLGLVCVLVLLSLLVPAAVPAQEEKIPVDEQEYYWVAAKTANCL